MDGIGADRVKAELDGETIAYVSTSKPRFKWIVKDESNIQRLADKIEEEERKKERKKEKKKDKCKKIVC